MKDIIRFYERNDYYTGKLLSAKDFKLEQQYINDKRSLLNVFTLGSGILYGLDVINTGDNRQEESISIKPGVAVDSWGRELIVPEIDTKVLVELEGFPEDEYNGAMYLCLEYSEKGIAGTSQTSDLEESDETRNNRIREGYNVVLARKPPEGLGGIERLYYDLVTLYEDDKVILRHKSPKYMNDGEPFECSFILIKMQEGIRVKLDYEVDDTRGGARVNTVSFESSDRSEETEKEYVYTLQGSGKDQKIILGSNDVKLVIGDNPVLINPAEIAVLSPAMPVMECVIRDYYHENLKERMEVIDKDRIYLAKIFMLQVKKVGIKYHIKHIEDTIFSHYIYPQYLQSFISGRKKETVLKVEENKPEVNDINKPADEKLVTVKTGVVKIPVKDAFRKVYFTDEIEHGLGEGQVFISAGLEERNENITAKASGKDEAVYSGCMELFYKSDFAPCCNGVEIGAVLYPNKGTFKVGVSVQWAESGKEWITVRWWAGKCEI
ncbi:MAG TPA: hypothetical protein VF941_10160 [Clostridia bacterium]